MSDNSAFDLGRMVQAIREKAPDAAPQLGLILGSGLSRVTDDLEDAIVLKTKDLPGYPKSTVEGHRGELHLGRLQGVPVAILSGRIHAYEGYPPEALALPTRLLAKLGIAALIVTNAAGGIRMDLRAGDLMLIRDHINLSGLSPLTGPNDAALGPRFPDQSVVWTKGLRQLAIAAAANADIPLHEGVYVQVRGPEYETPAEIRMLGLLGADAVGMSTVPEAIAAAHLRLPILGLSIIANRGAGLETTPLSHEDVLKAVGSAALSVRALLQVLVPQLSDAMSR